MYLMNEEAFVVFPKDYWANPFETFGNVKESLGDHSAFHEIPTHDYGLEVSLKIS